MKSNLLFIIGALAIGVVLGVIFGGVLNPPIPKDFIRNFENCTANCDLQEQRVETAYRLCKEELRKDSLYIQDHCQDMNTWTAECKTRISEYGAKSDACNNAYVTGMQEVSVCRRNCNSMISIKED